MPIRDFYDSGAPFDAKTTVYRSDHGPNGPWYKWMGPFYRQSHSAYRYRMESTPTAKVGNSYVYATEYGAFRMSVDLPGYEFVAKAINRTNVYYKEVADKSSCYVAFAGSPLSYDLPGPNPRTPNVPTSVVNAAIGRANAKLLNYPSWNAGQSIGEMRETAKFLLNSAITLGTALKALRGGNRKVLSRMFPPDRMKANRRRYQRWLSDASRPQTLSQVSGSSWHSPLSAPSNLYLGYQYGILPLVSDISEAAKLLSEGQIPNGTMHFTLTQDDPSFTHAPPTAGWTVKFDGQLTREVTVGYMAKVSNPDLYALSQYGLTDPLSLAWDLLPLSFVVDWFTGLGSFIDSLSQPIGYRLVDGFITRFQKTQGRYEYYLNDTQKVSGTLPNFYVLSECWKRDKLIALPTVRPHFKLGLDNSKLTSLAALMVAVSK